MTWAQSAADLRLVPHYIASRCSTCGTRLTLVDAGAPADEVWWDEWQCTEPTCPEHGLCAMDWPAPAVAELLGIARDVAESEVEPW